MNSTNHIIPAQLILQSGEIFNGFAPQWQTQRNFSGEVVFTTGMTGYEESLTDPSYAGQILTFTYPLIGNYGVGEPSQWEAAKIHASGVIVSESAPFYEHYNAQRSFATWLEAEQIPCIMGVDTRELIKVLRNKGVVGGVITTRPEAKQTFPNYDDIDFVEQVSIKQPQEFGEGEKLIIAVDCGMKENIMRHLLRSSCRVKRVPYDYNYTQEDYAGVFISNGPGDPARCTKTIAILQKALARQKPVFGICLGAQLMALAIGAKTYKLKFGHRGQNQPCIDTQTQRCYLTSQNHGYAVDEKTLPADWQVMFRHLNDNTVQGILHKSLPYFAVQFHPEAAPGPTDTGWLFERFFELLGKNG